LPVEALVPMDILLYRGQSFVAKAIQFFDGTEVSHASIYLGGRAVGEAVGEGVVRNDLATSIAGSQWVAARRLKATPLPDAGPVLQRADTYLQGSVPYAYHQLLLLAFLCISRKVKVTPIFDTLVRKVLDGVAGLRRGSPAGALRSAAERSRHGPRREGHRRRVCRAAFAGPRGPSGESARLGEP
jgi:hypothetical protein